MKLVDNNEINSICLEISKKIIIPKFNNLNDDDIMHKNNNDLVTSVDILVEEKLEEILCKIIPNSLYIGEEKFSKNHNIINNYLLDEYCWTVDPIDGTTNYIKGKEKFAIMIALTYKKEILQSWIYKPLTEEFCYAIKDGGTYIDNKKVLTNSTQSINNAKGSISSKYWEEDIFKRLNFIKNEFNEVKSYGCIGFEYIDIVKSIRHFAILSRLFEWDHIPGILILREAGGFDSHFDSSEYKYYSNKMNLVLANNNNLGKKIIELIKEQ